MKLFIELPKTISKEVLEAIGFRANNKLSTGLVGKNIVHQSLTKPMPLTSYSNKEMYTGFSDDLSKHEKKTKLLNNGENQKCLSGNT